MPKDRKNITRRAYAFNVDPSLYLGEKVLEIMEMARFNIAKDMFSKGILCKAWSIAEIDFVYLAPPLLNFGLGQTKPHIHIVVTVEILDEQIKADTSQGTN